MKKIFLIVITLVLSFGNIFGQTPLEYSRVIKKEGVSASDLFNQAKLWVSLTYRSAKDVIHFSENNHIIIKAIFIPNGTKLNFMTFSHNEITYTLEIETRDGRFRVLMYNMRLISRINQQPSDIDFGVLMQEDIPYNFPMQATGKQCKMIIDDVKYKLNTLFESLVSSLSNSLGAKTEDDW